MYISINETISILLKGNVNTTVITVRMGQFNYQVTLCTDKARQKSTYN